MSATTDLRAELIASLGLTKHEEPLFDATVAGVSGSDVIIELSPRVQGVIPAADFDAPPDVGARLRVAFVGREDELWLFSIKEAQSISAWEEMDVGSIVEGRVIGVNKGGLELKVGRIPAFMPASHASLEPIEDLTVLADKLLRCEVLELDREKKRLVVSHRAVLAGERDQSRREAVGRLEVGAVVRGKVARLESFGAFLELVPGIEGLLHVSNMAHRRVEKPDELVAVGQEIEVQILSIEEGGRRIGLGRKQLERDPWIDVEQRFKPGALVPGKVRRVADFGAFVELEPGVEGLVHVSQLGGQRGRPTRDLAKPNEEFSVRVIAIDPQARRISLSRLDEHGALIGSDDAVDRAEVDAMLEKPSSSLGTNLGSLLKRAMGNQSSPK